jgi:hypothetical protein
MEDAAKGAEWVAKALVISGYRADFSLDTLREVDRFFDEHARRSGALVTRSRAPGGAKNWTPPVD